MDGPPWPEGDHAELQDGVMRSVAARPKKHANTLP